MARPFMNRCRPPPGARLQYGGVDGKEAFPLRDGGGRFFRASLRAYEGDVATALEVLLVEALHDERHPRDARRRGRHP